MLYTAVGGLKTTFLTDFFHAAIALVLIIYLTIGILVHEQIGGLSSLYNKVMALRTVMLSFKSKGAIMFGLDLKFGNLALLGMVLHFPLTQLTEMINSTGYSFLAKALCNRSQRYRTRI